MASVTRRRKGRLTPSQARAARRFRRNRRKRFLKFGSFSAIAIIAFLFIVALFAPSLPSAGFRFGGSSFGEAGEEFAEQTYSPHVSPDATHPAYNSKPATSGWHYDFPVRWGIHDEVLPDETLVHNLEHGGIGIHYNCPEGCSELLAQLADFAVGSGGDWLGQYIDELSEAGETGRLNRALNIEGNYKVVLSPYPDMDTTIALTSWTYLDTFDEFDADRIIDFILAHMSAPAAPEDLAR